jgi:Domain of unknown function (DUF4124)
VRYARFAGALAIALATAGPAHAIYRCAADGKTVYQDTPCPRGAEESRTGPESPREAAVRRQAEAIAKAKADADDKAARDKARAAQEASDRKTRSAAVESMVASEAAWRDALYGVRVGMTNADLQRLHPRLLGGESRTMDSPSGHHEWRSFNDERVTLHLIDGVVAFVHRR